jgi:predicted small secreted protein
MKTVSKKSNIALLVLLAGILALAGCNNSVSPKPEDSSSAGSLLTITIGDTTDDTPPPGPCIR